MDLLVVYILVVLYMRHNDYAQVHPAVLTLLITKMMQTVFSYFNLFYTTESKFEGVVWENKPSSKKIQAAKMFGKSYTDKVYCKVFTS